MASIQKIRDSLFSISWSCSPAFPTRVMYDEYDAYHYEVNNQQPTEEVMEEVKNSDIFKYCWLSFKINRMIGVLDIKIKFSKAVEPVNLEKMLVQASKNGVQQKMILSQSKWTTSWNEQIGGCNYCLTNTQCSRCGVKAKVNFEILIDLTPGSVEKGSKHVLEHLLNLWKTKILSYVTFHCQGKSIKAHTLILASGSPVLAAMFQNDFKENQKRTVDIVDIKANIFENLLQYIYSGKTELKTEVEDVSELLVAADKYGVETLKEECAIQMSQNLKVDNAAQYLVLAHLHNSSVLHESTLQFMSNNAKAVCSRKEWMDIIKNYPELCFQATQLMVGL